MSMELEQEGSSFLLSLSLGLISRFVGRHVTPKGTDVIVASPLRQLSNRERAESMAIVVHCYCMMDNSRKLS